MKHEFSRQIFEKYSNTKFNENPFSGNRVVWFGQTDGHELIIVFRNFADAPKKDFRGTGCEEVDTIGPV